MKTEAEVNAYVEALDRKDEQLENELVRHQQLHLYATPQDRPAKTRGPTTALLRRRDFQRVVKRLVQFRVADADVQVL